jgi:hypothetical protein
MPPVTYESIATTTLGSAAATVTFSTIPGTYTDLVLLINSNLSGSGGLSAVQGQFNGDTGSNYSFTIINGDGSSATSFRGSNQTAFGMGLSSSSTSQVASNIIQIMNYSNTTTNKTVLARAGIADDRTRAIVSLWRNNNAITSITVLNNGAVNFVTGSTFTLYGIRSFA